MSFKPTYEELERRVRELEQAESERKRVEESLRESEEKYRSLFENAVEGIFQTTPDGRFITANPFLAHVLGFDSPQELMETFTDIGEQHYANPQERETFRRILEKEGSIRGFETRLIKKDGTTIWASLNARAVRDNEGSVLYYEGTLMDITDRKQAEEALRNSEEKYRTLVDQALEGIAITTGPPPDVLFANSSIAKIWGYTVSEMLKMSPREIYELIHPDDRELFFGRFAERLEGKNPPSRYQIRGVTKDNKTIHLEVSSTLINYLGRPAVQAVFTDITERRQAEERLEESERKLRTIIEHSNELFYIHDTEHVFTYVSPTSEAILGYPPEELKRKWTDLVTDNPFNLRGIEITEEAIRTGEKQESYLLEVERKDGTLVLLEIDESPVKDLNGNVIAIAGAARDVGPQKEFEDRLVRSEQRFRELFAAISDVVYTQDLEGRLLSVNPALCRLFGYDEEELIGRRVSDLMKPELAGAFESEYLERLKRDGYHEGTSVYFTKEGNKLYLEYRSSLVHPEEGEPYISGTGRDVTARVLSEREVKRLQANLVQANKMEAMGTLAGGIAHNFNNVLMGIQGRASLMMVNKDPSSPDYEHLMGIEQYIISAAELTRDLLGFARGGKYEVKPTDMNTLINHENRMFGRTKKEIRVQGKYEKDLWSVEVDPGQMRQVLLNLYVNAWQAMPRGGDLHIQTENVIIDEEYIRPFEIAPGRYVKVSVTDTGIGMDDATLEKVFDPFFTTKEKGQSSGLGLASVYGIVKNHGGFINVYSEEGRGSTFTIYLPASDKEAMEETRGTDRHEIQYGRGTVLLVDDEDMIIEVGQRMLEQIGYQVLIARSGEEALVIYEERKGEIVLVILDMIMPGMGGGKAYDRLKAMDGDVKALLSSGYSINGQAQEILDRGCSGFIQKPFALAELSWKVKGVITGSVRSPRSRGGTD